jgi:hypothetical protein
VQSLRTLDSTVDFGASFMSQSMGASAYAHVTPASAAVAPGSLSRYIAEFYDEKTASLTMLLQARS